MKLPVSWARSYAPFDAGPAEFAERMTMSGSKAEYYASEADNMKNVVVGRITELNRHPDSDHLWVCGVDVGAEVLQIVTGAQNLKEGDLCPVALHGAHLPCGLDIKRGKLRGVASNGMLCSLPELGLTAHDFPGAAEDGILVLEGDYPLGLNAAEALGMDEVTVEFEITPNRPDCLSVLGLAREAAATFGVPFSEPRPPAPEGEGDVAELLRVRVDAPACMRYSAAMVKNVRIAPSPRWMRERLRHAGVRPINNIVDITNYVMLEYGQPMHAFDYAYVSGGAITVRMARRGEGIVTLDGARRELDESVMVIADEQGPIAVAGVMGGENSGVYAATERVVFESACFDGPCVRAASRKLGLRTESSTRFEKGLDPNTAKPALRRALELVRLLDAGDIVGGEADVYPAPRERRVMPLRVEEINRLIGIETDGRRIADILAPLGFEVNGGEITVPTARADVALCCDIAEEVARFVGYDSIPSAPLRGAAAAMPSPRRRFDGQCVRTLTASGMWQCQTFSFYSPKCFDMINLAQDSPLRRAVRLTNPLGEETSIMRTTALPSIMEVAARNYAARCESCAVFEAATVYLPAGSEAELPCEQKHLVMAAYGPEWDYAALKGVAEALLEACGAAAFEVRRNTDGDTFHPGRCADIYIKNAQGEAVCWGTLGEVHPVVLENYGIRARAAAACLSLDTLFDARGGTPQYRHLPRLPAITRDLALVAGEAVPAADVEAAIRRAAGKRLESIRLFDVYAGEKLGPGRKSLAYSLVLRDGAVTLTDADADGITKKILDALSGMGVSLRA